MKDFLSVEIGPISTYTVLSGRSAEGELRIHTAGAPTTAAYPFRSVSYGVLSGLEALSKIAGKRIIDSGERLVKTDGDMHLEKVMPIVAAMGKIPAFVLGVTDIFSCAAAADALHATLAEVRGVFASNIAPNDEIIKAIEAAKPLLLVIAGGFDGGDVAQVAGLAEIAAAALRFSEGDITVLFAGNQEARSAVARAFGRRFTVEYLENVSFSDRQPAAEHLRRRVNAICMERHYKTLPGTDKIRSFSESTPVSLYDALSRAAQFIASFRGRTVRVVHSGDLNTCICTALPSGRMETSITANSSIPRLFDTRGSGTIPLSLKREMKNAFYNRIIRNQSGWTEEKYFIDRMILEKSLPHCLAEHAVLFRRRAFSLHGEDVAESFVERPAQVHDIPVPELLVASGRFAGEQLMPEEVLTLAVEAAGSPGFFEVACDSSRMLPHIGALLLSGIADAEDAARHIIDKAVPLEGYVVIPEGKYKEDAPACDILIRCDGKDEPVKNVVWGDVFFQTISGNSVIDIRPACAKKQHKKKCKRIAMSVHDVPLLVDARSRGQG